MPQPTSPAEHRRRLIWRHNAFSGHAAMMKANAEAIIQSPTATDEAKDLAARIQQLAGELATALHERIDP